MPTKTKENRVVVTLACDTCKERNYTTEKNRKGKAGQTTVPRLELNKYCPRCRQHRLHKETR